MSRRRFSFSAHPVRWVLFPILLSLLAGCQEALYSDLSARVVNEMVAILEAKGISASRRADGEEKYSLLISQSDFSQAVKLLTARGLPRKAYKGIGEVFQKEGLVSTPFEEKARYVFALSEELLTSPD